MRLSPSLSSAFDSLRTLRKVVLRPMVDSVGLEGRDWYRERPSKAWLSRWHGSSGGASGGGDVRVHPGAWLAIVVSAAAIAGTWYYNPLSIRLPGREQAAPPTARSALPNVAPAPAADNVVRLRPSPKLNVPARSVQRWTLRDPRFGSLVVVVPVGKTPREAMIVALAERGYQVVG
jgi:hypothetical protein